MIDFNRTYNRAEFLDFLDKFLPADFLNEVELVDFKGCYTRNTTRLGVCESLGLEVFEIERSLPSYS